MHVYESLMRHYKFTEVEKFARVIDVPGSTIRNSIDRGSKVTAKIIEKIRAKYPEVSENWLKTGKGKMLEDNSVNDTDAAYTTKSDKLEKHLKDGNNMMNAILSPDNLQQLQDDDIELFSEYKKVLLKMQRRLQQKKSG